MYEHYDVPYRRIPCYVEMDGINVFGFGSYLQLVEVTNEHYEVKIYSGIANFFNKIKELKLSDLSDEGKYAIKTVNWRVEGVKASFENEDDYAPFAIIDWDKKTPSPAIKESDGNSLPTVDVRSLYPCVKLKRILQNICEKQGYSFKTDVETDPLFENAAIPCVKGANKEINIDDKGCFTQNDEKSDKITKGYYNWDASGTINSNLFVCKTNDSGVHQLHFIPPTKGGYTFLITKNTSTDAQLSITINGKKSYINPNESNSTHILSAGDVVFFELVFNSYFNKKDYNDVTPYVKHLHITMNKFKQHIGVDDYYNNKLPIANNLPDVSQLDVFKQFVLMFGQIVYVDEQKKSVNCYSWSTVYDNLTVANNWSNKIDNRQSKQNYIFGEYGQCSKIKYKDTEYTDENNETKKIVNEGYFNVENKHLTDVKVLFEMKAAAVDERPLLGLGNVAKMRYKNTFKTEGTIPFVLLKLNKYTSSNDFLRLQDDKNQGKQIDINKIIYANYFPINKVNK